jgi:nitric oxide reductase NorD protein
VQTSQPHEQAEDPVGLQRPTDRDASTAAEELADSLSELPQAKLVSTPGRPREILLSQDTPLHVTKQALVVTDATVEQRLRYPEWDYRALAYREQAVTVHLQPIHEGPQAWVDRTCAEHRSMLHQVRRRFELLRAQRLRLRKQLDGDDIDIDAYVQAMSDFRAGLALHQSLYQSWRQARRDLAILILTDASGSTDSWISDDKRVVDVEREALLLVAIALQGMHEPFALHAFSGEGPHGVVVRELKRFEEPFSDSIARRIAALEPEHYTRAGAAIRHASATLMGQGARHRLLLLLSDGKPNDIDAYEGRYGVEDMRQAVTEARLQGIHCFCLTIDRQAASYLPGVFGPRQYGLLPRPGLLPTVLLDWMKRLVQA